MFISKKYIDLLKSVIGFLITLITAFTLTLAMASAMVGLIFVLTIIALVSTVFRIK